MPERPGGCFAQKGPVPFSGGLRQGERPSAVGGDGCPRVVDHDELFLDGFAGAEIVVLAREGSRLASDMCQQRPIVPHQSPRGRRGGPIRAFVGQVHPLVAVLEVVRTEAGSLQPHIKLANVPPGGLACRHPLAAEIRERTVCSVAAVERKGEILFDFPSDFEISGDDALYLCGTGNAFSRYREAFAE